MLVIQRYMTGVLKHLNVRRFLSVHFESVIPASLAGVFLHSIYIPTPPFKFFIEFG